MNNIKGLKIKIFADGADIKDMEEARKQGIVSGFTTNPSLMKKAGVTDYEEFAKKVLAIVPDMPVSFEVFSDDFAQMEREALKISGWGNNVNVKIPVTNTNGEPTTELIRKLSARGLFLNVTAIMTAGQVGEVSKVLNPKARTIISVFAGRIADSGRDPEPYMKESAAILKSNPNAELLWASSRELLNIFQAEACGCHIITVTPQILKKIPAIGKDLGLFSLETVRAFHRDAVSSGYKI
ncbi:MAG: transaldolase [Candidatus Omnitrophota bacterium]|jgi:transaldolase